MKRQKGFSLVELMVALLLSLVLIVAVIELFISSRQLYRTLDVKARMQEDGRYAVYRISEILGRAGYQGCSSLQNQSGFENNQIIDGSMQGGRIFTNTLTTDDDYFWRMQNPVEGHEAAGNVWSPALPGGIINATEGSDVLTIRTTGSLYVHIDDHNSGTAPLTIPADSGLDDCDPATDVSCSNIMMVSNCYGVAVFQVTNDPSNGTVEHAGGVGSPGNRTNDLGGSFANGWLNTIASYSFFVRDNPNGVPSLYQKVLDNNADVIIEGVEQMQIIYGLDTNGDLSVDIYRTADAIANWSEVISIRISFVMINVDEDAETNLLVSGGNNYFLDGQQITPDDRELRRVFTQTILLRNRTQ